MKRIIKIISSIFLSIALMLPMTSYAAGDPNIGGGGGVIGDGSDQYYWNETYDGARLTLVRADTGAVASQSIDISNRDTGVVQIHFGSISKKAYTDGQSLSISAAEYEAFIPASTLPKIINCALIPANIQSIKNYFCDEMVLRWFAGKIGMNYDTMIGGDYKLMVEPVLRL